MSDLHGDLDALVTEVHRRVEQRALERVSMAERRAREVLERADEEAARTVAERARRSGSEVEVLRARGRARARMDTERASLRAREELLEQVWRAAERELAALAADPERYLAALRRLARLAAATLAATDVTLATDEAGRALLTPERLEAWGREDGVRYGLADDPATSPGVEARAGRVACDATFATRLSEARTTLRETVARRLLGEEGDAP